MIKLVKKLITFFLICILSLATVSSTYASIFDFFNFTKKSENSVEEKVKENVAEDNSASESKESTALKTQSQETVAKNHNDLETLISSNIDAENIYDEAELKVEKAINDILDAIKNIDFKKVVALSDYNGTYDTRYIDQFFDKYDGSKDIVETLLNTVNIKIKDIEKIQNNTYKALLDIEMIDLNKLVSKISLKVGLDIVVSKFKASENGNDIINIILKRIAEVINKDSYEKINFEYNVELIKISESYKLSTQKIISDVETWIQAIMPFFEKR